MKKALLLSISLLIYLPGNSQNLINNGGFENDFTNWTNLAGDGGSASYSLITTEVVEGTQAMQVTISTLGTNSWSIQSMHSGWTSVQDQTYTLSFYGKASLNGSQVRAVQQNTSYAFNDFVFTDTWQKYEWSFVAKENDLQLKFNFNSIGTVFLDDIQILGQSPEGNLSITITPAINYQQMVGFGGALTWHCDRITSSAKKNEIAQLIFSDLGIDVVRLKNWYYPSGYPGNKNPATMEVSWFKPHFDATSQLYTLAKQHNPDLEVLLSCWGPPSSLKSNNNLNEGTLNKNGSGQFMYSEYAQYWVDVLDNIGFNPDYISIQNEPGFTTPGWTTCEWRPAETSTAPGYTHSFEDVYIAIKNRPYVPKMIGPETENIGSALWNSSLNTFREYSTPIKDKAQLSAYAYHLYNFHSSPNNLNKNTLNMIRNEFGNVPNWMTEFSSSNFDWLQTADAIHETVTEANASAYVYWELMWDENSTNAMIRVDGSGNYTIGDHYYALKHFAKHIDKGYSRIAASGGNINTKISAYKNPDGAEITVVAINNSASSQGINLNLAGITASSATAYQSSDDNFYQDLGSQDISQSISLPAKSLTTFVISTGIVSGNFPDMEDEPLFSIYPNPSSGNFTLRTTEVTNHSEITIYNYLGEPVKELKLEKGQDISFGKDLNCGVYFVQLKNKNNSKAVKIIKYLE